jgi:hypothetical protein
MGFGSYDNFIKNDLHQQLLIHAVQLCKLQFSSIKPNQSTVIGLMGMHPCHFDNLLLTDTDQRNFSFGPKYPNRQSMFSTFSKVVPPSPSEEKQD